MPTGVPPNYPGQGASLSFFFVEHLQGIGLHYDIQVIDRESMYQ